MKSARRVPIAITRSASRASRFAARAAGRADRADVPGVIPGQDAFAGLRFRDRDAEAFGQRTEVVGGVRVDHAAAGDDQRPFGGSEEINGFGDRRLYG